MWAIIKKEVRTYFLSPIGYVFVGLFLLMASLFFYSDILVTGLQCLVICFIHYLQY